MSLTLPRNSCHWKTGLTETFRNASSKIIGGYGSNLQNPSKLLCRLYKPDRPDLIFLQPDLAGAESVAVALLVGPGNYRDLIKYRIKAHVFVALHLFKDNWAKELGSDVYTIALVKIKDINKFESWPGIRDKIKKHEERYFIGKKTGHSANYSIGVGKFRDSVLEETENRLVLSTKEAKRFLDTYYAIFPEIKLWHYRTQKQIKETRLLHNFFGYPKTFHGPIDDRLFRKAYAWIPQSTIGCITNKGLVKLQQYIERENKNEWDILNNKHDSLLMQCPESEEEEAKQVLREVLTTELISQLDGEKLTIGVEISKGRNWGKYDEEDNPEGMKEL
jgi:hypothetical protein